MVAILTEFIQLLVGGISSLATGIGSGLQSLATAIFVDTTGETYKLTIFGGLIGVFCGVALAISLSRWVMNFVTSLGN